MAEDKSSTPEQQLLKLIEGQKGAASRPEAGEAAVKAPKKRGVSPLRWPGLLLGVLSFSKRKAKKRTYAASARSFGLPEVNKVMAISTVALFIYVIFDAVASARLLQSPPSVAPPKETRASSAKESVPPLEESSFYLQKVSARDIFKEGKKEEVVVEQAQAPSAAPETAEAVQKLSLVGISWSKDPDAIIEDKSQQRTYFVKRGQMAGDNVKVEAIFKDHVIVSFEDKEYELR